MRAIKARLSKFSTIEEYVHGWGQYYYIGGILLPTRNTEPTGTNVTLHIQIATGDTVLRGEGVVEDVRNNAAGDPVGMVIRFTKLDSTSKALVDQILDQKRASRTSAAHVVSTQPEPQQQEGPELDAIADALDQTFDSIFGGSGSQEPVADPRDGSDLPVPGMATDETEQLGGDSQDPLTDTSELQPTRLADVSTDEPDFPVPEAPAADAQAGPANESVFSQSGELEPAVPNISPIGEDDADLVGYVAAATNLPDAPPAEAAIARLNLKSVPSTEAGKPRAESADFPEPPDLSAHDVASDVGIDDGPTLSDNFRAVAEKAAEESKKGELALAGLLADTGPLSSDATELALPKDAPPKGLFARIAAWFGRLFGK